MTAASSLLCRNVSKKGHNIYTYHKNVDINRVRMTSLAGKVYFCNPKPNLWESKNPMTKMLQTFNSPRKLDTNMGRNILEHIIKQFLFQEKIKIYVLK